MTGSHGASTSPTHRAGPSRTPTYSAGPSTSSPGNAECSNCKFLTTKVKVIKKTIKIYMYLENHIVDSSTLFHDLYNDMEKLDLE